MFCSHCGTKHQPNGKFCTGCGTPAPAAVELPVVELPAAQLAEVAQAQSVEALRVVAPAAAVAEAPVAAGIGAAGLGAVDAPAAPVTPTTPAAAWFHETSAPAAAAPSPVPQYAPATTSLPPVPSVYPSVAAAPRSTSTMPDFAGMARGLVSGENGQVDKAKATKIGMLVGGVAAGVFMLTIIGRFLSHPSLDDFFRLVLVFACATFVLIAILAVRAHQQETREARTLGSLPPSVQHVVAQMEPGAQAAFFNEYERYKKRIVISYVLLWIYGAHNLYLRQPMLFAAYLFTGGFGGVWFWFDLFRMPSLVRAANEQTARQALQTLHIGATFAQMPQTPAMMVQPVPPAPVAPAGPQDRV